MPLSHEMVNEPQTSVAMWCKFRPRLEVNLWCAANSDFYGPTRRGFLCKPLIKRDAWA